MKIAIVAGEISGDNLGAGLINAIKTKHPSAEFIGIGGPRMIEAGCKSLFPLEKLSIMGLVEILRHYRQLRAMRQQLIESILAYQADVFIGVDAPAFNIGLGAILKRSGIKTVQYVCPQVWAWREGRIPKIRKAIDLILAILPFEESYLKKHQINARFVGHSLADEIPDQLAKLPARQKLGIAEDKTIIALMPGSREKEWQHHIELFIQTARLCQSKRPKLYFIGIMVNQKAEDFFNQKLRTLASDLPIKLVQGNSLMAISAADVVLAVSGTAALEIMLAKRPMVIVYKTSWITYQMAKRLVKIDYLSLPNLLADEQIVPEFIQQNATTKNLSQALFNWLDNPKDLENFRQKSQQIHDQLRRNACDKAADAVLELCAIKDE